MSSLIVSNNSFVSKLTPYNVAVSGGVSALVVALAEHIMRLYDIEKRPSYVINSCAVVAQNGFRTIGEILAWASGFIKNLKLAEFMRSCYDLIKPLFELSTSWTYIGIGWVNKVKEYLGENFSGGVWQYVLGAIVLISVSSYLVHKYSGNPKWCPYIQISQKSIKPSESA